MSYEQRKIGDVIVTKTLVLGTNRVVYSAWKPGTYGSYFIVTSSINDNNYRLFGRLDTELVPDEFEALPSNTEARRRAVNLWQTAAKKRALAYVYAAFPELVDAPYGMDDGQIVVEGEHV